MGRGGGNIFYYVIKNVAPPPLFRSYDLGGSGGMPPPRNFFGFRALRQLLVQSEAKILIELLNICG